MILKPFPAAERPALRLKVYAAGALIGRRAEWGYRRKWEANYLFIVRSARCCSRVTHTHTHTHGPLSGTTPVSRYKKGKTNLDFTEARDSEW